MSDLSIAYHGYLFDASGYGYATRAYIHALHAAGVAITAVEVVRRARQVQDPLVESLLVERAPVDLHLFHGIPTEWARQAFRIRNAVGMTVWETDSMPSQWRNPLNHVKDVWLPCAFNVNVFAAALESPVFRLPHPLPPTISTSPVTEGLANISPSDFVVYSIFQWQERKHPHGMLEAFCTAFADVPDAVLVLKTSPDAALAAERAIADVRARGHSGARIAVFAAAWAEAELAALHTRGDCYLSLHRGEGWGYPLFEAAARGTPVVATAYSGPLDYLGDEHGLVRHDLVPVRQRYAYYDARMRWADPDLSHAVELLRRVYENRVEARVRAARGAERIAREYSLERVGAAGRDRLVAIRDALASTRRFGLSRGMTQRDGAGILEPSVPVPPAWYDADYFEHGIKSNWQSGYSWTHFGGLFRAVADFLTQTFPEARSFLDAGCAKGFLVRALRERGTEAIGFDHSAWAIDHAEHVARPFVARAGTDDFSFAHDVDVLVAFDLFSHLTEEQAELFLRRARAHVQVALLATIVTGAHAPSDRDRTHVTVRDRAWWLALFRRAGWQQDALHRMAERACQRHSLSSRMQWDMYLLSPGEQRATEPSRAADEEVA
jgi:glycosyltransferase involved in cell wall biosynthesis/SAM-dependent methyltransferase